MRSCLKQNISAPSPAGYGWQIEDGTLHITWMTRNPAPDCGCKGACETGRCSCFSAGLCCTDLCRCCNCANTKETEELEDNRPDTDSEDWVSLICYFLFSFVQFYISYFIFFIKIVFMVHPCCFHLWKNEWMNEWMRLRRKTDEELTRRKKETEKKRGRSKEKETEKKRGRS